MKKIFLFSLALPLLVLSCNSIPEPSETNRAFVIGQVWYSARGTQIVGGLNLNDEKKSGIEITIKNLDTAKTTKIFSGNDGMFKTTALAPGNYVIEKLFFRIESATHYATPWINTSRILNFEVKDGAVNNLGQLMWTVNHDEQTQTVLRSQGYVLVMDFFEKAITKSQWATRDRVKTAFRGN